jgi:hypothetical protein
MAIRSSPLNSLIAYATKGKAYAFPVPASKQAYIYNLRAFNNSGAAQNVGIMQRFVASEYTLWKYVNIGAVYTNLSATLAAGTPVSIFTGTVNDGFVVQANQVFGMVGFTISTNQAGGTFTYKYWNGSAFTTLTTLEVPANYNTTGDNWVVFQAPVDWVIGGPTGVNQTQYSIFVQSTVVPAGAVSISAIWVAEFLEFYFGVPNNAAVQLGFSDTKPYLLNGGEGIIPYFSVPNATNQFGAFYSFNG